MRSIIAKILRKLEDLFYDLKNWKISYEVYCRTKICLTIPEIESPVSFHGLHNMEIGENFNSRKNLKLRTHDQYEKYEYSPTLKIGNDFYSGTENHISIIGSLTIGNNVTLASRVTIIDHSHGEQDFRDIETPVMKRKLTSKGPIHIEDNVWLCENVVVLGGVTIGKNSIIAANSVVTSNIPPNCVAAGAPAIVKKQLK